MTGVAYMDMDQMGFTLLGPLNENRIIASFNPILVPDITDYTTISVIDSQAIDLCLLLLYGALAVDNQSHFRQDN